MRFLPGRWYVTPEGVQFAPVEPPRLLALTSSESGAPLREVYSANVRLRSGDLVRCTWAADARALSLVGRLVGWLRSLFHAGMLA